MCSGCPSCSRGLRSENMQLSFCCAMGGMGGMVLFGDHVGNFGGY